MAIDGYIGQTWTVTQFLRDGDGPAYLFATIELICNERRMCIRDKKALGRPLVPGEDSLSPSPPVVVLRVLPLVVAAKYGRNLDSRLVFRQLRRRKEIA